jgi:hypothetical protein
MPRILIMIPVEAHACKSKSGRVKAALEPFEEFFDFDALERKEGTSKIQDVYLYFSSRLEKQVRTPTRLSVAQ